jgi:hypothetical protein
VLAGAVHLERFEPPDELFGGARHERGARGDRGPFALDEASFEVPHHRFDGEPQVSTPPIERRLEPGTVEQHQPLMEPTLVAGRRRLCF